jgi:hypothetical protein
MLSSSHRAGALLEAATASKATRAFATSRSGARIGSSRRHEPITVGSKRYLADATPQNTTLQRHSGIFSSLHVSSASILSFTQKVCHLGGLRLKEHMKRCAFSVSFS